MLGSKYTPRSAISFSASSLANAPCSTWVQPAFAARIAASALWACTIERSPCALASPHAACSCSSVIVGAPPSRMLFDAKILMKSAPSAFCFTT